MDVQLYVYDLSRGLARQMSRQFLGTHIDAIYHTSLVFGGVEYFFGRGIQMTYPGSTHHGRPMEVVQMGHTSLPMDVIAEYLEALRETYTADSYDLFARNCNNFSNDFATFLVGRGIPDHITSLPRQVLETPFGQMLRPQLDTAMRGMTQASIPPGAAIPNGHRPVPAEGATSSTHGSRGSAGQIHNVVNVKRLQELLEKAKSSCAVIFFTSATCAPCRLLYPTYDELAAEAGSKCTLIKVDISQARDVASMYNVRATPTFISYLKGKQEDTLTGASPAELKGNIRMLIQSAFPQHPHTQLSLPTFRRHSAKPVIYSKIPPLDKLSAKLGSAASEPSIKGALSFIHSRNVEKAAQDTPIPDLPNISASLTEALTTLPPETRFVAIDILRLLLLDQRISSYYLTSPANLSTLVTIFAHVVDAPDCPYSSRLTALHAACNLFTCAPKILAESKALANPKFSAKLTGLVSGALLDKEHSTLRVAASSLAYNLATLGMNARERARKDETGDGAPTGTLSEGAQVELAACLIEAVASEEESKEAITYMVLALGRIVYLGGEGEVWDLCRAMEAGDAVRAKGDMVEKTTRVLVHEVGVELLGRGLRGKAR